MNDSIQNVIDQMSIEEKATMLAGADTWRTVPNERLGIRAIQVTDGPNGARGEDDNIGMTSVCVPCGIALGATWNVDLVKRIAGLLAKEAKAKGAQILLAPTVNIHRTPIAGRNFECYAEDPYLNGKMAASYVNGLQEQGVGACIKHFVCNDQEFERNSISSEVTDRPLHEIYLEPFRIAMEEAGPWSVMSAYNKINGTFASENDPLLRGILKGKWGFDGVVMSDWYGTYTDDVPAGGLDLEMPGPARYMNVDKIVAAVEAGELDEAVIDDKIARLLRLIGRVTDEDPASFEINTSDDQQLTREAAAEAIVLLKNDESLLPLDPDKKQKIVVIGENAKLAQIMGGGSAQVNTHYAVSPFAGIESRAGDSADVEYHIGQPLHRLPPPVDVSWLTTPDGSENGFALEFFDNLKFEGEPSHVDVVRKTMISWFGTVNPYIDPGNFSMRLRGTLQVPEDGDYKLHFWSLGQGRMWLDGEMFIDHWRQETGSEDVAIVINTPEEASQMTDHVVSLKADKPVEILIEFATEPKSVWRCVRLGCVPPLPADPVQEAVDAAADADVAIVIAGLTSEWESEGHDRPSLSLVREQDELIRRVAAVNPNTVVVLNVGSPVTMPWLDDVPAVMQCWYAGQETGNALADLIFGDVNPSAKLPITLPKRLQDNPAWINYPGENGKVHYGEGIFVGYRYYEKKEIEPLFPFGHGLSYTSFGYSNLVTTLNEDGTIAVQVDVTNDGDRAGQEVVQLYLSEKEPKLVRPEKELKGFAKVALDAGESETVTFTLTQQSLSIYDPAVSDWTVQGNEFVIRVGRSSADICVQAELSLAAESGGSDE